MFHFRYIFLGLCFFGEIMPLKAQMLVSQECGDLIRQIANYYQEISGWSEIYMKYNQWGQKDGVQGIPLEYEFALTNTSAAVTTPYSWVGYSGGIKLTITHEEKQALIERISEKEQASFKTQTTGMLASSHPDSLTRWCQSISCWKKGTVSYLLLNLHKVVHIQNKQVELPYSSVEIQYDQQQQRVVGATYTQATSAGGETSYIQYLQVVPKIPVGILSRPIVDHLFVSGTRTLKPAFKNYQVLDLR